MPCSPCRATDGGALAQAWPARPIRLLIPYPPGGGADTLCRPYAERMRARLGQPMVVENRAGAATTIGMEAAARAAPDGHTLVANTDNVSYFPFLYARLPYDLFRDFAPVTYLASSPLVLAIHPGVPARDLGEFVALARREPGRLTFANSSVGAPHHLAFELLAREAGMPRMLQAEYRGGGPALNDVLAGHVQVGVFTLGAVGQHFAAGTLRPLAVLGGAPERLRPRHPDRRRGRLPGGDHGTALRAAGARRHAAGDRPRAARRDGGGDGRGGPARHARAGRLRAGHHHAGGDGRPAAGRAGPLGADPARPEPGLD